jgi:hypothetical protein
VRPAATGRLSNPRSGNIEELLRTNPKLRALAQQEMGKDRATFDAQQATGAGLLADEVLRYFQRDYENRVRVGGPSAMPTNHRIVGSFFNPRYAGAVYLLWPERDYLISFSDFLDFVTAGDSPTLDLGLGYTLTDNVIYNVTATDGAGALLLSTQGAASFGFRAASIRRLGDELVMLISVAEQLSAAELKQLEPRTLADHDIVPEKRALFDRTREQRQEFGPSRIVCIEGTDLLPSIALVRFNLNRRSVEGRCLLRDMGDRFDTLTDIFATLTGGPIDESSPAFMNMVGQLDDCDALWEMAKALTLIPAYLDARITVVRPEKRPTKIAQLPPSKIREMEKAKVAQEQRLRFRTISAIRVERAASTDAISGRSFTPPRFQISVDGFWRELANPDQLGKDAEGLAVKGRTWVRAHVRFKDRPAPTEIKTVYIKASLSVARQRLEAYRRRMAKKSGAPVPAQVESILPTASILASVAEGSYGAFVYVMRCHAHAEDLFKVGFTDRDPEVRAKELSASTSSPLPFIVLRAWAVSEGRAAEQAAHAALAAVRLSENREFFHTPFADLQALLEIAIKPWVLNT